MALSNVQIASHMKRNSTCFYKVFAYDQFRPENCPFLPIAIVVNTEPLVVKMGHWVALYVDQKRRGTFFDSYGMQPWGKIVSFFEKNATSTQFNKIVLQKDQTSCGHHAIFFLTQMSKGHNLDNILQIYRKSPRKDFDSMVVTHCKTHWSRADRTSRPWDHSTFLSPSWSSSSSSLSSILGWSC